MFKHFEFLAAKDLSNVADPNQIANPPPTTLVSSVDYHALSGKVACSGTFSGIHTFDLAKVL